MSLIIVSLVASTTMTFGKVVDFSMAPTLSTSDIFTVRRTKKVRRFDVVYLKESKAKGVKRVIGIPGDELYFKNDNLVLGQCKL